jgi:hypothetical protein
VSKEENDMKKIILKTLGSILIVLFSTITFAQDFIVFAINDDWSSESFGPLPFRSACLAFDSDNNAYANNLVEDFYADQYKIYTFSAPDYNFDEPLTLYVEMDKTFEAISGINFDRRGNLYVSEVLSWDNNIGYDFPDAGLIRKISANTKKISDPVIYKDFRPTGIAVNSPHVVYFSGRKWSDESWGNIYKISNFQNDKKRNNPSIEVVDVACTAIATDRWETIFAAPRFYEIDGWPVFARNPYTGSPVLIATFSKLIEELTFDADGNLYAIEANTGTPDPTEIIKLIPPNIVINGCDTKIIDWALPNGNKISDIIKECNIFSYKDEYVGCVARSVAQLIQEGYISGKQLATIVECAAKADDL